MAQQANRILLRDAEQREAERDRDPVRRSEQRGEHRDHAKVAGEAIDHRNADLERPRLGPVHDRHAGYRLGDVIVGPPVAPRPLLPETAERQHDQARVVRAQLVVAQPQPRDHAGAVVLHHHVGPCRQFARDLQT